jgi:hypothetical protein
MFIVKLFASAASLRVLCDFCSFFYHSCVFTVFKQSLPLFWLRLAHLGYTSGKWNSPMLPPWAHYVVEIQF